MITINSENIQITLTADDNRFVNDINNRITAYGTIPYTVPKQLIVGVIRDSARMFYRQGYYKSQQKVFYRLVKSEILKFKDYLGKKIATDPSFVAPALSNFEGYIVNLPGFVNNVMEIYETNKGEATTSMELLENVQLLQHVSPYGQSLMGINNSLYIIEAAVKMVEEQNFSSIFGMSVPFNFNTATKSLLIKKEVTTNLMLDTICNVDIQHLYNDDLFIRHVIGCTKRELKRIIGGHTKPLPGETTLNPDEICNNLEDVEKVEEILKAASAIGDIIMQRD